MPTLQELTGRIRDVMSGHPELSKPGLSRAVTLDLGETGCIRLDDGAVDNADGPGDCRIALSADDLEAMMDGRLDPTMAYMSGQLRVDGDMPLALQLASALRKA